MAKAFCHTAESLARVASPFYRTAESSVLVVGSFCHMAESFYRTRKSCYRAADWFCRAAGLANRTVGTFCRMTGWFCRAAEPLDRTGESFCRTVFPQKHAQNGQQPPVFPLWPRQVFKKRQFRRGLPIAAPASWRAAVRCRFGNRARPESGRGLPHTKNLAGKSAPILRRELGWSRLGSGSSPYSGRSARRRDCAFIRVQGGRRFRP